jgi:ATPase family associated with various cellular activities (AAA)
MSNGADWQVSNARYLAAAMTWLRAVMEQFASEHAAETMPPVAVHIPVPAPPADDESRWFWRHFRGHTPEAGTRSPEMLLPSTTARATPRVAEAAAAMHAAEVGGDPPPALVILAKRLGLSQFEQELLLLCIGMELDTGTAGLCARSQKDSSRNYPTFALAFSLFDEPTWDALSPERPLRYWRLLEITQGSGQPLTASALRADERILNYCKGLNYLDDRLIPLLTPIEAGNYGDSLPPSHRDAVDAIVQRLKAAGETRGLPLLQLLGADAASKQLVASEAAIAVGLCLYRLPVALLPTHAADIETLARLWQRETLLLPLGLYVDALAGMAEAPEQAAPVTRLLDRVEGALFLDSREAWPGLRKNTVSMQISLPTASEQMAAWQSALGQAAADNPGRLAAQFNLSYSAIRQIAQQTLASSPADGTRAGESAGTTSDDSQHRTETAAQTPPASSVSAPPLDQRLWEACLASTRPQMDTLAERLESGMGWDDLVLPPAELALLHQIVEQVGRRATVYESWGFAQRMSRGLGISALFAGDSGAGKTLAAEVIAHELRMTLYRIDLSAVVSKYIGETAKNLRRLFDAAESGGAILFFDEADALFGKRSEVKDSHDRYANIEINYLLQRMEAFRGLAILATNMKSALDPAFMRRLRFVVQFPFPGVTERKAIWQRVFPAKVPLQSLDYGRLARFNITGGLIHNIAVNAAFLAARCGTAVTMPLVLEAARGEFRKIERPINEADFQWQEPKAVVA